MEVNRFKGNINGFKRHELDKLANALALTGSFSNKRSVINAIRAELTRNGDIFWDNAQFSLLYRDNDTLPQRPRDDQRSMSSLSSLSSLPSVHATFADKLNALLEGATAGQLELVLQRVHDQTSRLVQEGTLSRSSDSRATDSTASVSPPQHILELSSVSAPRQTRNSARYEKDSLVEIPETPPETPSPNPYDQNSGHCIIDKLDLDAQSIKFGEDGPNGTRDGCCGDKCGEVNEYNVMEQLSDECRISSRCQEVNESVYEGGQPLDASFLYKHRNYVEEKDYTLSLRDSQYYDDEEDHGNKCSSTCANMGDTSSGEKSVVSTTAGYESSEGDLDMSCIDHKYMDGDDDLPSTINGESVEEVFSSLTGILAYPQAIENYMEDFIRVHQQLFTSEFGLNALAQEKLGKWESLVRVTGQYIIALAFNTDEGQIQILGIMDELVRTMVSSYSG